MTDMKVNDSSVEVKSGRSRSRFGRRVGLALGILFAGWIYLFVSSWMARRPVALPDPNGYDDLVKAGREVELPGVIKGYYNEQKLAVWRREAEPIVDANRGALDQLRPALTREIVAPRFWLEGDETTRHDDLAGIQDLARLAHLAALIDWRQGRTEAAVKRELEIVRLGHEIMRGGIHFDLYQGRFATSWGLKGLSRRSGQLDSEACRQAAVELIKIDEGRERIDRIDSGNQLYLVASERLINRVLDFPAARKAKRRARYWNNVGRVQLNLCALNLAIRAHQLDEGKFPETLEELIPEQLVAIPEDPFSVSGYIYRRIGRAFELYHSGPDGEDNGGEDMALREINKRHPEGDILQLKW